MNLFAPPTESEITERREIRSKNCVHTWSPAREVALYRNMFKEFILVIEAVCCECNLYKRTLYFNDTQNRILRNVVEEYSTFSYLSSPDALRRHHLYRGSP